MTILHEFVLAFVPLFVAIDVFGVLPVFIGFTHALPDLQRKKLVTHAVGTAFVIAVCFLFFGKLLFQLLGITDNDFRVGGGIVLLVLSVYDLLFASNESPREPKNGIIGVVPIGIPLIMGPAALTTLLILLETHGPWFTITAVLANFALVWGVFRKSHFFSRILGEAGAQAFAKVASLFLTAIAVMMIRKGIVGFIEGFSGAATGNQ